MMRPPSGARPLLQTKRREITRPSEHSRDFDECRLTSIHDAEIARETLAKLRRLSLGYYATRVGELAEAFDRSDQPPHRQVSPRWRVNLYEGADLLEVRFGARRPQDVGHRPRRRLTSS